MIQETELTDQQKMSAGLRELADFYDEHPEICSDRKIIINHYVLNRAEFLDLAKHLKPFKKDPSDKYYSLVRMFGPIKLDVYCERDLICTKRMVTKTIEVEEWDCPEHLLSGNGKAEEVSDQQAEHDRYQARKQNAPIAQDGGIA